MSNDALGRDARPSHHAAVPGPTCETPLVRSTRAEVHELVMHSREGRFALIPCFSPAVNERGRHGTGKKQPILA